MVVSVDNDESVLGFASFPNGGIFYSSNEGGSWTRAIEGHTTDIVAWRRPASVRINETHMYRTLTFCQQADVLFAGQPYGGVLRSDDWGSHSHSLRER